MSYRVEILDRAGFFILDCNRLMATERNSADFRDSVFDAELKFAEASVRMLELWVSLRCPDLEFISEIVCKSEVMRSVSDETNFLGDVSNLVRMLEIEELKIQNEIRLKRVESREVSFWSRFWKSIGF